MWPPWPPLSFPSDVNWPWRQRALLWPETDFLVWGIKSHPWGQPEGKLLLFHFIPSLDLFTERAQSLSGNLRCLCYVSSGHLRCKQLGFFSTLCFTPSPQFLSPSLIPSWEDFFNSKAPLCSLLSGVLTKFPLLIRGTKHLAFILFLSCSPSGGVRGREYS